MFKRILVASDAVARCDAAVSMAAGLAEESSGALFVLHVLESAYSGKYRHFVKHFETGAEIVAGADYEQAVKAAMAGACAENLAALHQCDIQVKTGFPWEQILKWAREAAVDLIVLGPHSEGAKGRGVVRYSGRVGSTVEGVLNRARCPVMIVSRFDPGALTTFNGIMVCVDFSKSCRSALLFAVRLATKQHSRLHIFHMLPLSPSPSYPQDALEAEIAAARERLKTFCKEDSLELDAEFVVWEGATPHQEILKYAREKHIDLIAMGSHTKEKSERWYVGSAVEQVGSRSRCPVVVVTDPKALATLS